MLLDVLPGGNGKFVGVADGLIRDKASLELGVPVSVSEVDEDVFVGLVPELGGNKLSPAISAV